MVIFFLQNFQQRKIQHMEKVPVEKLSFQSNYNAIETQPENNFQTLLFFVDFRRILFKKKEGFLFRKFVQLNVLWKRRED